MTARTLVAIIGAMLAVVAGVHLAVAVAAAVIIVVILASLAFAIVLVVADSGWRVQPCRRRFAW